MDLTNYMLLACERNMISNKFGLDIFYTAFKEAAQTKGVETGFTSEFDTRFVIGKENFYLSLTYLAKALYADEGRGAFDAMFADMLQEKIETHTKQCKKPP